MEEQNKHGVIKIVPWVTEIILFVIFVFFSRWFYDNTIDVNNYTLRVILCFASYGAQGFVLSYYYHSVIDKKKALQKGIKFYKESLWAGMLVFALILMWTVYILF